MQRQVVSNGFKLRIPPFTVKAIHVSLFLKDIAAATAVVAVENGEIAHVVDGTVSDSDLVLIHGSRPAILEHIRRIGRSPSRQRILELQKRPVKKCCKGRIEGRIVD